MCPEYDSRRYLSQPPTALLSSGPDAAESAFPEQWFGGLSEGLDY